VNKVEAAILRITAFVVVLALACFHLLPARSALPFDAVAAVALSAGPGAAMSRQPVESETRSSEAASSATGSSGSTESDGTEESGERSDDSEHSEEEEVEDESGEELEAYLPPSTTTAWSVSFARLRPGAELEPEAAEREVVSPPPEA